MTQQESLKLRMSLKEILDVRSRLGREPTEVEWSMLDVMHSEHCSYKSSRPLLASLPTRDKHVIVGPGFDCGIVDIGNNLVAAFKIESHNHPSALEPYNGAATGIGGIVRDILSVGAKPIALLDPLRFGPPTNGHSRWLLQNVVRGIANYGNSIGVPTVGGEIEFDASFEANCLVNVACLGIARKKNVVLAKFENPGDLVVLIGGSTGRDGIHGVTFASKTLASSSEEDRPAVQIGDPFTKKLLIEAVLEITASNLVTGLKDLGGGGLTCACSEMSAKGGTGIELDLEKIHVREEGMLPYEFMLSESQERMLVSVQHREIDKVKRILDKYGVPYSIIGNVTPSGRIITRYRGHTVADIPAKFLTSVPIVQRQMKRPAYLETATKYRAPDCKLKPEHILLRLLGTPTISDKEWVYNQYDHEVGLRTLVRPGEGDAAVLRLLESEQAVAIKPDSNSCHTYLDPFSGAAGSLAESVRNVTAVGGKPLAYTDGCNFGNPEDPEVFWQFNEAIRGLKKMSEGLAIPCVGGNVSFYNEDQKTGVAVKPTIVVVTLGIIDKLKQVTTLALKEPGQKIIAIGKTMSELGGSEFWREIWGVTAGRPPRAIPTSERRANRTVRECIRRELITAAHDCSRGGVATGLAIMSIKGGIGAVLDLNELPRSGVITPNDILFSESHGRFLLTCQEADTKAVLQIAANNRCKAAMVGETRDSDELAVKLGEKSLLQVTIDEMQNRWKATVPHSMGVV